MVVVTGVDDFCWVCGDCFLPHCCVFGACCWYMASKTGMTFCIKEITIKDASVDIGDNLLWNIILKGDVPQCL